jgi:hypothetical protein
MLRKRESQYYAGIVFILGHIKETVIILDIGIGVNIY